MIRSKTSNRKIWVSFLIICLLLALGLYFFVFQPKSPKSSLTKGPYFIPLAINEFTSSNIPCIKVEMEGKSYIAKIDLGFDGGVKLPSAFLKDCKKKIMEHKTFYGIRGKKYEDTFYEVPQIAVDRLIFHFVPVGEINIEFEKDAILKQNGIEPSEPFVGRVGWWVFRGFNFFWDGSQRTVAVCDSLNTLKKQGYPVELFTEVPFLLDRGQLEFEAITEQGPLRCILDTGATWSMLNKDLEGAPNDHILFKYDEMSQGKVVNSENADLMIFDPDDVYEISSFKIGSGDFGPIKFKRIKVPFEVDAILGMDFFDITTIFIDFANRKLYFYQPSAEERDVAQAS